MAPRRILILGSGGREHALAWRIARDPATPEVIVAPGNDGIGRAFRRLAVDELDAAALVGACRAEEVTLVVIGPEAPLAFGVADALREAGIAVFGASQAAARIESSKWFAKQLMESARIPTARAEVFEELEAARQALARFSPPFVVKADGLAAGKGVLVAREREAAEAFLAECLEGGRFGAGGRRVLIEEFLEGEEASLMAVCDGKRFVTLPPARDYKRAYDRDLGPNTGGMGAFAPHDAVDPGLEDEVGRRVIAPVLAALEQRNAPFRGALYCGLMLTAAGPRVVEFNCRLGDPETEAVLPLVEGDFSELLAGAARGALEPSRIGRASGATVVVTLVGEGYPERPPGGGAIDGLEELMAGDEVMVFHAGTAWEGGAWKLKGGRAAHVVVRGGDRAEARRRCYAALALLGGEGWRCRHDIAALEAGGPAELTGRRAPGAA